MSCVCTVFYKVFMIPWIMRDLLERTTLPVLEIFSLIVRSISVKLISGNEIIIMIVIAAHSKTRQYNIIMHMITNLYNNDRLK
jgi:hypothetical protein